MERLPRLTTADTITREAGVTRACYALKGNQPARLRRGQVFTVDGSIRRQDGGLSELAIPHETLAPGPQGRLRATPPIAPAAWRAAAPIWTVPSPMTSPSTRAATRPIAGTSI